MNQHILDRLAGIQKMLVAARDAGGPLSSASKGSEREYFISQFLEQVFPPPFRFGHGDITDTAGRRSGQLDVVVEYPFLPSLPVVGSASSRLYLAEGVAAAMEVKSDLAAQWGEVASTANSLAPLQRHFRGGLRLGPEPLPRVPLIAIGYSGWKQLKTIESHMNEMEIDGILVIDSGLFVGKSHGQSVGIPGPWAFWGFISFLHTFTSALKLTAAHPVDYFRSPANAPSPDAEAQTNHDR